ncbi:hypothetical protein B0H14DRAFT_3140364, partial [Mycena olivaceomarginata]
TVRRGASEAEIPDLILRVPVSEVSSHQRRRRCHTATSGHSPTTAAVSTASSTHRGPYNCDPDSVSVPGARSSPLLAPLSFQPFLDVGIDLGHVLDALHGITNFDAIFRALAAGPFRSW